MEEQSIVEEFSEVIGELIDILSEKVSDHEVDNYAKLSRYHVADNKEFNKGVTDKHLSKGGKFGPDYRKAIRTSIDRIERKAREAAKRPENELNVRKQSKMTDRAESNARQLVSDGAERRRYSGLDPKKAPANTRDSIADIRDSLLKKNSDDIDKKIAAGHEKRSQSVFKKPLTKPRTKEEMKNHDKLDQAAKPKMVKPKEEMDRAAKIKRANHRASIALESLVCSDLLESTKVEILESIRNYLVD